MVKERLLKGRKSKDRTLRFKGNNRQAQYIPKKRPKRGQSGSGCIVHLLAAGVERKIFALDNDEARKICSGFIDEGYGYLQRQRLVKAGSVKRYPVDSNWVYGKDRW